MKGQRIRNLLSVLSLSKVNARFIGTVGVVVLLCGSQTVSAVCVLEDYSVRGEFDRSIAIIVGTVVSERSVPATNDFLDGVDYTVRVAETLRGRALRSVDLFNENSSGRFPMLKGKAYVLFIYRTRDRLMVDNCGNSGLVADKKEVLSAVREFVKRDREPRKPD